VALEWRCLECRRFCFALGFSEPLAAILATRSSSGPVQQRPCRTFETPQPSSSVMCGLSEDDIVVEVRPLAKMRAARARTASGLRDIFLICEET